MSNLNSICVICGNVISCICEVIEVPEVDVYVVEESELPCCVSVDKVCIFCPHCGDEGSGPCACEFCDYCGMQTSNRRKNGISENGECLCNKCHEENYHAGYQYPELEVCDSSEEPNENGFYLEQDEPESVAVAVAVAPLWVETIMATMMIISFFGLVIDIITGKNNNPKLVTGFYLVCAYLVVTYGAVIIWFLC
jgi:hypothetical protein